MFPQFKIKVTGLIPYAKYLMLVDLVTTDNFRYKWKKDKWKIAGKAEPQPPCQTYVHPDSPSLGSHWMKEPVSFQKLKLTNNTFDQQGHAACKREAGPFIEYDRHSRGDHAGKVNGEYSTSVDAVQHFICLVVFEDHFLIYGIHGDIVVNFRRSDGVFLKAFVASLRWGPGQQRLHKPVLPSAPFPSVHGSELPTAASSLHLLAGCSGPSSALQGPSCLPLMPGHLLESPFFF